MQGKNRRIVLSERPRFQIPTARCFKLEGVQLPEPGPNQIRIRSLWLGLDPFLFSRVKQVSPGARPVPIGAPMYGAMVGQVDASNRADFREGDLVSGLWPWQDFVVSDGARITKVDPEVARPSWVLGALGASGFGAWLAVNDVLRLQPGETVTFGAAVGGLGQIVGQLAKLKGAHVIGVAGGPEKCRLAVQELGFDACIDHKNENFEAHLEAAYAGGIDAYVHSTGGPMFDSVMRHINLRGRVAVCGLMAFYSMNTLPTGPDRTLLLLNEILLRRLEFRGSLNLDHINTPRFSEFQLEMGQLISTGKVKPLEHIVSGLENAPDALQGLFEGHNLGKAVVEIG